MGEFRQALFMCLLGSTGSGKTSTLVHLCKYARENKVYNEMIGFDPHEILVKEKLLDFIIRPGDEHFAERLMQKDKNSKYRFYNCGLILDDYRSLLSGNHLPQDVLDLLMLRRKLSMDIFYVCHSARLILERFSYFTNVYAIFYTESTANSFVDRIPSFESCQKAANLINRYVRELGGVESDKYRSLYPNFPHVIVRTNSTQLEMVNMDIKIVNKLYK